MMREVKPVDISSPFSETVRSPGLKMISTGGSVGRLVGDFVGNLVGDFVEGFVGDFVGGFVGERVGDFVGDFVGALVVALPNNSSSSSAMGARAGDGCG
jgi:hypothetical protein